MVAANALQMFSQIFSTRNCNLGRRWIEVSQILPLLVLATTDSRQQRVLAPSVIRQCRNRDIKNGKYKVTAAKLFFSRKKCFEFKFAEAASDSSRRNDRVRRTPP
jgi:hypothetical protein